MECSRCGGRLETYALNGSEACVCEDCGFVDTPFEHDDVEFDDPEPWSTAIERFYEKRESAPGQE
jgi:hypothetical protein